MRRLLSRQRRGTRVDPPRPALPEALLVEGFALAEQVVDGPAQPRRQDRQRLGLAALRLLLLLPLLATLTAPQEQAGRLAEGPAQVGVADLLAARALLLARRLVGAAHQPGVRQELADVVEAL